MDSLQGTQLNPEDFRIRRDLYFPYTEAELECKRGKVQEPKTPATTGYIRVLPKE